MDGSFEPTVSPDSGHLFLDKIKTGKKKKVIKNKEISRITHNFAAPVWRVYTYTAICRGICFLVCWALSPLPLWKDLCRLHSAPLQNKRHFFFFPPTKHLSLLSPPLTPHQKPVRFSDSAHYLKLKFKASVVIFSKFQAMESELL